MTLRTSRSGIPPISRKPPIAEELEKLREKPPRTGNRVPLSRLEKLAILDGLKDGESPARIGSQWNISKRTVSEFKSRLFDAPLSLFHYNVIDDPNSHHKYRSLSLGTNNIAKALHIL